MDEAVAIAPTYSAKTFRVVTPWWPLLAWLGIPLAINHLCLAPIQTVHFVFLVNNGPVQNDLSFLIQIGQMLSLIGVMIHGTLATIYLAWSPGRFVTRFLMCWLSIVAGAVFWFMGYLASPWIAFALVKPQFPTNSITELKMEVDDLRSIAIVAASIPLLLLGLQIPCWLTRVAAGWRLVRSGDPPTARRESLSIGDLMLATAIVAICCALMQVNSRQTEAFDGESPLAIMVGMLIFAAFATAITSVVALPLSWMFLLQFPLRTAWLMTLIGSGLFICGCMGILGYFSTFSGWHYTLGIVSCAVFSYVGGVSLGLSALRSHGWHLVTRWSKS